MNMTDMTVPQASQSGTEGTSSLSRSIKSALGTSSDTAHEDNDNSEVTFTDFLQLMLQSTSTDSATSADAQSGKPLPADAQTATSGQPEGTITGENAEQSGMLIALPVTATSLTAMQPGQATDTELDSPQSLQASDVLIKLTTSQGKRSTTPGTQSPLSATPNTGTTGTPAAISDSEGSSVLAQTPVQLSSGLLDAQRNTELSAIRQTFENTLAASSISDSQHATLARPAVQHTVPGMEYSTLTNTPVITETIGHPEWSQGLGKQVLWMVNHNVHSAELKLNPAHLGPIEVRIDMDDDQVNIAFTSRHAAVRDAVEMALPRLREMFESNGMNLASTDISHHSFAEQRENMLRQGNADTRSGPGIMRVEESVPQVTHRSESRSSTTSMIDYYI